MGGDPFGMLLRQRIVFLGGEVGLYICFAHIFACGPQDNMGHKWHVYTGQ